MAPGKQGILVLFFQPRKTQGNYQKSYTEFTSNTVNFFFIDKNFKNYFRFGFINEMSLPHQAHLYLRLPLQFGGDW